MNPLVLIILDGMARTISKPIAHLAAVTKTVAEGRLEDIDLPSKPPKASQDNLHLDK